MYAIQSVLSGPIVQLVVSSRIKGRVSRSFYLGGAAKAKNRRKVKGHFKHGAFLPKDIHKHRASIIQATSFRHQYREPVFVHLEFCCLFDIFLGCLYNNYGKGGSSYVYHVLIVSSILLSNRPAYILYWKTVEFQLTVQIRVSRISDGSAGFIDNNTKRKGRLDKNRWGILLF